MVGAIQVRVPINFGGGLASLAFLLQGSRACACGAPSARTEAPIGLIKKDSTKEEEEEEAHAWNDTKAADHRVKM